MKKIIVMFAVVGATMFASAASLNWYVLNVYTPSASVLSPGTTGGGAKMTTTEAANLTISIFWDSAKGSGDAVWEQITPVDGKSTLTGSGTKASGALWSQATAVENRNGSGNAYFKVVLNYTDGATTYTVEKETGAVSLANITSSAKTATFNMNNMTWTASGGTPEPTSGLLLLLGGAMLALRRKQK